MASLEKPRFTPQQYLTLERQASHKSEFFSGEIFAMAGASFIHNLIVANVLGELRSQLRGSPCRAVANDQRVLVQATGLYCYPDVVIVCGQPQFSDDRLDTVLNPTVIVEVLSGSTEAFDRGAKFAHYRRLESLQDYVLITQNTVRIEHFVREEERWVREEMNSLQDSFALTSVNTSLRIQDVYESVEFTGSLDPRNEVHNRL